MTTDGVQDALRLRPARRWYAGGAVAAFLLAGINLVNVLGSAYRTYAEAHLDEGSSSRIVAAARTSAALTPWSAPGVALAGWLLADKDVALSESYYRRALRWAPGDPLLWSEYATAEARAGRTDALQLPVEISERLAPASPAVQSSNAALAINQWTRSPEALRKAWAQSIGYQPPHDRHEFLRSVVARGRLDMYCSQIAPAVGEQRWCDRAAARVAFCKAQNPDSDGDLLCLLND